MGAAQQGRRSSFRRSCGGIRACPPGMAGCSLPAMTLPSAMSSQPRCPREPGPLIAPHQSRRLRAYVAVRAALLMGPTLALSGCTVGFWSYQQIGAPEAQYIQVNCNGRDGPPKLAYYPFHGIFIGVAIGPLDLRLRTPRGMHAHLNGD